jgi:hypothetical protein
MLSKREKSSTDSKDKEDLEPTMKSSPGPSQPAMFSSAFKKLKIGNRITLVDERDISYFEEKEKTYKGSSVFFKMTNNFYKNRLTSSVEVDPELNTEEPAKGLTSNPRNPF